MTTTRYGRNTGTCDRLLFGCLPLPTAAILSWAAIAVAGPAYAAPSIGLALFAAVGLYAVPLPSALGGGGAGMVSQSVNTRGGVSTTLAG